MRGYPVSLRKSAQQAMLWSAGLNLFRDALQFLQMLVLVRLLDPAIYGMAGYATTIINFLGLISFQNIVGHVVQVRQSEQVDYNQHFTFGVLLNGSLFIVANLLAVGLRFFPEYAGMQPILHVLSFTFLLSVPVDLRQKMLERDHSWARLRPLQMAVMAVSVISGLLMAWAGFGVYALIVPGLLAGLVFVFDLFVVVGWRPHWSWNWSGYRDALHFGFNRAGSNALNSGRKLLESTLISKFFHFASLGVFGRADSLSNLFCGRVAQQVLGALYPVITRAEPRSEQFQRIAGLVLRTVAWIIIPIAVVFALEAHTITTVLYGIKWQAVIPLLPLAMAVGAFQGIGATAYQLLLANEERNWCLRSDAVAFVIGAGTMVALIPFGMRPYLMGAVGVNLLIGTFLLALLLRTGGVQPRSVTLAIVPPTLASLFAAVAALAARSVVPEGVPMLLGLMLIGMVFGAAYVLALRLLFRVAMTELVNYVPGGQYVAKLMVLK